MSRIQKLKDKFNRKPIPNDIRIDEAISLAKWYGCDIATGGNHQIRIVYKPKGKVIPIPQHGDTVKEAYIKQLKQLFDEIERE